MKEKELERVVDEMYLSVVRPQLGDFYHGKRHIVVHGRNGYLGHLVSGLSKRLGCDYVVEGDCREVINEVEQEKYYLEMDWFLKKCGLGI